MHREEPSRRPGFHWQVTATLIVLMLAPILFQSATAAQWVARHGMTGAQYQQTFDRLAKKGYRLSAVSGYENGVGVRYAALWTRRSGPSWVARHGLTPNQYQKTFDSLRKKGYRLTFVNGYSVGNRARYAAIWEKRGGPAWSARHGLGAQQYQQVVDSMSGKGYALVHVSAYSINGTPRFAAIFEKGGPAWIARHGLTGTGYQRVFDSLAKRGYRLKVVSGYRQGNGDRYAAIWVKSTGPRWSARHGVKDGRYQNVFDSYRKRDWVPQYIEGFNSASGVRFNGIWHSPELSS